MIEASQAFKDAMEAYKRKMRTRTIFTLRDPDAVITGQAVSTNSPYSKTEQITDDNFELSNSKIGALEQDRIKLDGSWALPPDDPSSLQGDIGWWSEQLSGDDGTFAEDCYAEVTIRDSAVLQAFSVVFSGNTYDGVAERFMVEVYSAQTMVFSKQIENNKSVMVQISAFTAYNPTKVKVIIQKWSIPYTRARLAEIYIGLREEWQGKDIKSVEINSIVTFDCLTLPYCSCDMQVDNKDDRFDPYNPTGLFQSLQDRQSLPLWIGAQVDDNMEWIPAGLWFQQNDGWETQGDIATFHLVDIVGMLTQRKYTPPQTLPTDLEGWVASIVSCLGENLKGKFIVDDSLKKLPLSIRNKSQVSDLMCGKLLQHVCQATLTYPYSDPANFVLRVTKKEFNSGIHIKKSVLHEWPKLSGNSDVADIIFKLNPLDSEERTEVVFAGSNTNSDQSINVDNPFVHDIYSARKIASNLMASWGGKKFSVNSRGNPLAELGDIETVDTAFNRTVSARLYSFSMGIVDHVMANCTSELIQSPSDTYYEHKVVLTGSGTWKAPAGVRTLYITLVSGGEGGDGGEGGMWLHEDEYSPEPGKAGKGGKVYAETITINSGQSFNYSCGKGGKGGVGGKQEEWNNRPSGGPEKGSPGQPGTDTTFGAYSSANGKNYPLGVSDVDTGKYYGSNGIDGRPQVDNPKKASSGTQNSGNAGSGGDSGANGSFTVRRSPGRIDYRIISHASDGAAGGDGADGVIIIRYNNP